MAKSQDDSLQTVGVILSERVYAGLIVGHKLTGELTSYPAGDASAVSADSEDEGTLIELPTESIVKAICRVVSEVAKGNEKSISAVGIALPGLIRNGVVEEAPNLPQLKGARIQELVSTGLAAYGISASVCVLNDADAMAAGLASQHDKLDHFIRVWTLGTGIGYGRYPFAEGVWEGGHSVVTLDEKENYCGCGGRGHLEGIMGHRSMRLRFLDMEPEEVFEAANRRVNPDPRCVEFKHLWHKALAAATASSIHMAGSGKFFITGYNVRFLDLKLFKDYMHQMVKMSPIQGYSIEVVDDEQLSRVIGAAVAAEQAHGR
ncbi:ROK family protein [Granulicella mallensis]|jgi:glucokinase|uniref:Putative NBD/HSP70 family sugar kinase n=1 Tax=Granulicella mallensis TaxID=940614 RepID=A0A7W8E900_9BACT|nr:ROK family protein [Granulicella mallensis]MBB5063978.1 putative NBD/HSP70 family sugar kinase [Granulicella mallensis]